MTPFPRRALLALSFANFVVGVGAFVVVGLLGPILREFDLTRAQAGFTLTAYALAYAAISPVAVALTARWPRWRVLIGGLALFLAGVAGCGVAPSYGWLLATRIVAAAGASVLTPVASSVAVAMAAPEDRPRALGLVFGGLTLAQVAGVPVGSYLGYALGWRMAFLCVGLAGLAALPALLVLVPRTLAVPAPTLSALAGVLASGQLMRAEAFTALFCAGLYVVYTFLGPFAEARLDAGPQGVSALLAGFGLGAVAGNALGALLTRRIGAGRTLALLAALQAVLMPALMLLPLAFGPALALTFAWSVCAWSFMVPQQARLVALAPDLQSLLLALNASAIYLGAAGGAVIGGAVLERAGFGGLGLAAAGLAALALVSLTRRKGDAAP